MKTKSKLLTIILNCFPGLGHLYLGFTKIGFLLSSFVFFFILSGLQMLPLYILGREESLAAIVLLWVLANIHCIYFFIRESRLSPIEGDFSAICLPLTKKNLAMFFSIIPGVGHLYLGFTKKGLELMIGFFLTFYLTDFMRVSLFLTFAPVIWFYSIFDVLHKSSSEEPIVDDHLAIVKWFYDPPQDPITSKENLVPIGWLDEKTIPYNHKHKILGYILVFLGGILILNRNIEPLLNRILWSTIHFETDLQTAVVGLLLIYGGYKLICKDSTTA